MTDQFQKKVADAVNLPEPVPPWPALRVKLPELDRSTHPPALAQARQQPGPGELLIKLDAAIGALPTRFWRDARAVARRLECEEQLTAVEDAIDAVVSARE